MENRPSMLNNLPFMFEKNIGQHDEQAKFVLRQNLCTAFFVENEVVLALSKIKESSNKLKDSDIEKYRKLHEVNEYEVSILRIKLENSNLKPEIVGEEEFKCKIDYLKGSSKYEWTTDIPIYERVIYKEVYPGIDLVYYGNQGKLEHDFIVSPDSDIKNIKMKFEGADNIELDEEGNILISINENTITMLKPRVYQEKDYEIVEIDSDFVIEGADKVSFKVEEYDENTTLIIDPQLLYGSYLGGPSNDFGYGVAADNNGYAYITGYTLSLTGFPITSNAYQQTYQGGQNDAFLIKIDTRATTGPASLLYATYIGGTGRDEGRGIAVDSNENAYITGLTDSTNFPTTVNGYRTTYSGNTDSFLIKIDTKASTGPTSLVYGTYIGGNNNDYGYGVAVDSNEYAYLTGMTNSSSGFPLTPNAYQSIHQGVSDVFLVKIDTKASTGPASLLYGTYLGGSGGLYGYGDDYGQGIAIDSNQYAYITGYTYSTSNFPLTPNAYQSTFQGGKLDAFLLKIDTRAVTGPSSLLYGTYLGGPGDDSGQGVAVDDNQNAYITGYTSSTTGFPITTNGYQQTYQGGSYDAFLIKIDTRAATGSSSLLYGTYLGGTSTDQGMGVGVDANQNAYITGYTLSYPGFPITYNAYQKVGLPSGQETYITKINTRASTSADSLLYSSYIGGYNSDEGASIAVDSSENAYVTGYTYASTSSPITNNAYQNTPQGGWDAFLRVLNIPLYDLTVNKTVNKSYSDMNTPLIYTITVSNNGPYTLNNINFIDTIPNNTTLISNSLKLNGTTITGSTNFPGITIPSIGLGATSTIQFSVSVGTTIPSPNYITNAAIAIYTSTIDSTTVSFNSNIVTTTINSAYLQTSKNSYIKYADIGDTITYTVSLLNMGNVTAYNIVFIDTIPSGTVLVPNSFNQDGTTIAISPNPPGVTLPNSISSGMLSTVSFAVTVTTIPSPNPIQNSSSQRYSYIIDSSTTPNITGNGISNTNIVTTTVSHANLNDIFINVDSEYATCDDIVAYTVNLYNSGNITAENIYLADTIPNGISFVPDSVIIDSAVALGKNPFLGMTIPNIGAGNVSTVSFKVKIDC